MTKHTIFQHATGPMIQYDDSMVYISDLNPELEVRWRMTRWERIKVGFGMLWSATYWDMDNFRDSFKEQANDKL